MALSGHAPRANECPLLGAKGTSCGRRGMSANDPKRTCRSHRLAVFTADEIDAQLRGLFVGQSLPTKRTPGEKIGSMSYCRNKAFLTLAMTRPGVDEHVAHVL